jgi:hypothetical protein
VCLFGTGGEKYLEHIGSVTVTNHNTGDQAVLQFKEAGWGGPSSRNRVEGKLLEGGEGGDVVGELVGKWDESLARRQGRDELHVLWRSHDLPRGPSDIFPPPCALLLVVKLTFFFPSRPTDAQTYYGFTSFATELNEITDDLVDVIPPTDTRLRPDQRALEEGRVDEAEDLKGRLEDAQRRRRQEASAAGDSGSPRAPQFFEPDDDDDGDKSGGKGPWRYKGTYFTQREKRQWTDLGIFDTSSSS